MVNNQKSYDEMNCNLEKVSKYINYVKYYNEHGKNPDLSLSEKVNISNMYDVINSIELELNKDEFPNVLKIYGNEMAKVCAVSMCLVQKKEFSDTNLISMLINLESDL